MSRQQTGEAGGRQTGSRELLLLERFRNKTQQLNRLLEEFDLYGLSSEAERQNFWEDLFLRGEEVMLAFREIVALRGGSGKERW